MYDFAPISAEQTLAVKNVMAQLTQIFPGMTPEDILTGPLATEAIGPLPGYSNRTAYQLSNVTAATVGAGVICYGKDPVTQETSLVLMERGPIGRAERRFGITGGYINLDCTATGPGEQPRFGALRELGEELCGADGKPILSIDAERLRLISSGVDYRQAVKGGLAVHYEGYAVCLTDDEMKQVHTHIDRLHNDPDYFKGAYQATHGETLDVIIKPAKEAVGLDWIFTHPHDLDVVRDVAAYLSKRPVSGRSVALQLMPVP